VPLFSGPSQQETLPSLNLFSPPSVSAITKPSSNRESKTSVGVNGTKSPHSSHKSSKSKVETTSNMFKGVKDPPGGNGSKSISVDNSLNDKPAKGRLIFHRLFNRS
jgi:hypothetical protein